MQPKNILIVYAHHEPTSFTASMKNVVMQELTSQGHQVVQTDLYGQGFNAVAQKWDFVTTTGKHFNYMYEQKHAATLGMSFAPDINGEINKLLAADYLVIVAPIWWLSVPAILKGWFDRVLAMGVAWDGEVKIYENGLLRGKQAMMIVSAGGPAEHYTLEGKYISNMAQTLHPINHGTLAFCGFDVHETFAAYNSVSLDTAGHEKILDELRFRIRNMVTSPNWLEKY